MGLLGRWAAMALGSLLGGEALACADFAGEPGLLVDLEPLASRGALSPDQLECLELAYRSARDQTVKNKISRVELVNAYASDTRAWAGLARRHLDEVDRSDPDLAYLYALWLSHQEPEDPAETIRWSEVALERKSAWEGATFVSRVYGLLELRARAAGRRWEEAEQRRSGGSKVSTQDLESLRTEAKVFAREWLEFAKASGRDPAESLAQCASAAGSEAACGVTEAEAAP